MKGGPPHNGDDGNRLPGTRSTDTVAASLDPALFGAYEDALLGALAVARNAAEDPVSWATPTETPGWTVGEMVANIVGVERALGGWPEPAAPVVDPQAPPTGSRTEPHVVARRGRPPAAVAMELEQMVPSRLRTVRAQLQAGEDVEVPDTSGQPVLLSELLPKRVLQIYVQEQDIRRSLGKPGHLACRAADLAARTIAAALPSVIADRARVEPGNLVKVAAEGQTRLREAIMVGEDRQGRSLGADDPWGVPSVDIDLPWETLLRLACGRVTYEAVADQIDIEGNATAGRAILKNMDLTT